MNSPDLLNLSTEERCTVDQKRLYYKMMAFTAIFKILSACADLDPPLI